MPNDKPLSMRHQGARQEGPVGVKPIVVLDDATMARGTATRARGVGSGSTGEALIFEQPTDSGFGWFMKSDDVFGYGTWATRQIFDNGFAPGDQVSSYDALFFHSTFDDIAIGDATVMMELWDGDPMSVMETICAFGGVSAPIPGTRVIFSGIPWGTVVRLRAELPEAVAIDCDRV